MSSPSIFRSTERWKPVASTDKLIIVGNNDNCFIAYNPTSRQIASFSMDTFNLREVEVVLAKQGMMSSGNIAKRTASLTFSVSDACGMDCVYCFTGENGTANADFSKAKKAIDNFFGDKKIPDRPTIAFFGSGEPFENFHFVRDVVLYVKERVSNTNIKPLFLATTNCMFGEEVLAFILEHKLYISASVDGPPKVQNFQRPLLGGGESSGTVMKNVKKLIDSNLDFHVRSTITAASVNLMPEMVKFWADLGLKKLYLEPVSKTGSCKESEDICPTPEAFAENFIASLYEAMKYDICVNTEAVRKLRTGSDGYFCPAIAGDNILYTTDGRRAFCYEDLAAGFSGPFTPSTQPGNYLVSDAVNPVDMTGWPLESCKTCPIYHACGGTCPRRALGEEKALLHPYQWQCKVNKLIVPEAIAMIWKETLTH